MKALPRFLGVFALLLVVLAMRPAAGQALYSQNFDIDDTANWANNPGNVDFTTGMPPNVDTDSNFFFDYSTAGIPSAPHSAGGTTRGMRLQANINPLGTGNLGVFGGYTVSPLGQSFSGDYSLKADVWANYIGTFNADMVSGGIGISAAGGSMLSQVGIMSPTDFSNSPGFIKGVLFSATGDGGSTADYRLYSEERVISYQVPGTTPEDNHAVYSAGSRNNTNAYYLAAFNPASVPAQAAITNYDYKGSPRNLSETQYGTSPDGTIGMQWLEWEVRKEAGIVSWFIGGTLLGTVDTGLFAVQPAGANISFGHADINSGISTDPNYAPMMFTLVDNIRVEAIAEAGDDADFDNDGDVDGTDLNIWGDDFGVGDGMGTAAQGDANGDGNIDGADFLVWQRQFGTAPGGGAAGVPEPATWGLAVIMAAVYVALLIPRRRLALARARAGKP